MFNAQVLGHMLVIAEQIVTDLGASKTNGYHVVIDNELNREQSVYHPQLHVMAGCDLQSLPG